MPKAFGDKSSTQVAAILTPATTYRRQESYLPFSITPQAYASGPRKATQSQTLDSSAAYQLYDEGDFARELTIRLNNLIHERDEALRNLSDAESAVEVLRDEYVQHQRLAYAYPREQRLRNNLYWARSREFQRRLEVSDEKLEEMKRKAEVESKMDIGRLSPSTHPDR